MLWIFHYVEQAATSVHLRACVIATFPTTSSFTMTDLKSYIITLKESASDVDYSAVKLKISELGGKIVDEFSLIKGFTAKLPAVHSELIKDHEHVFSVEEDKEVHTQ